MKTLMQSQTLPRCASVLLAGLCAASISARAGGDLDKPGAPSITVAAEAKTDANPDPDDENVIKVIAAPAAKPGEPKSVRFVATSPVAVVAATPGTAATGGFKVKSIELGESDEPKERTWLGVGLEEVPPALASQLGLDPGVGLVVTFVSTDSPAAKAGLQKNDVLVEFEGQSLVLSAQVRKLVQARKEGDKVKLTYYRGGKKQTAHATLAKTKDDAGGEERIWVGSGQNSFWHPGHDLILKRALEDSKLSQAHVQAEVEKSIAQAQKAYQEAMKNAKISSKDMEATHKAMEELAKSGMFSRNNSSVTVRRSDKGVKSMVSADDSGTIVIVSNPKMRLTAHDKDGNLLFDGEIETSDQREKVPKDLWEKVEPMIEKMNAGTSGTGSSSGATTVTR